MRLWAEHHLCAQYLLPKKGLYTKVSGVDVQAMREGKTFS